MKAVQTGLFDELIATMPLERAEKAQDESKAPEPSPTPTAALRERDRQSFSIFESYVAGVV